MAQRIKSGTPTEGSLWERDDEVFRVEKVYDAQQRTEDGGLEPVTLVKIICVEPMPTHCHLPGFLKRYEPYDPEAE